MNANLGRHPNTQLLDTMVSLLGALRLTIDVWTVGIAGIEANIDGTIIRLARIQMAREWPNSRIDRLELKADHARLGQVHRNSETNS